MKKEMTCIVCPRGCRLTAELREDGTITVTGNGCSRGERHAIAECTNPVRTLTASVRVENRPDTMVSLKSAAPIPRKELASVMEQIHQMTVRAPIAMGEVILRGVCGTNLIATKKIM